ncbi:hypothetical protein OPV22_011534 [Ensete ventricosum]|uniref:Uncharacterized protein n=1 Tax=Ensete ventricosum TaxID=4639 RepID=A0AAV8RJ93_ENSVE|nr:hypothetical protein OPV22_011534 [Ensete ventricosum]
MIALEAAGRPTDPQPPPTFESARSFSSPNTSAAAAPLTDDRRLNRAALSRRLASTSHATPRPARPRLPDSWTPARYDRCRPIVDRWPSRSFMGLDWRRNGACDPWRGFALCRCGLGLLLLVPQISKAITSKSLPLGFPTLVAESLQSLWALMEVVLEAVLSPMLLLDMRRISQIELMNLLQLIQLLEIIELDVLFLGGLLFAGGLLGFIFSRNATAMIYGGAILALSVLSLKVWRTGRSSVPFILGQAAFSAAHLWKLLQAYSLSKKVFPTGLYIFLSAAMICFYSYVLISGGNPPPKKLAAAPPS